MKRLTPLKKRREFLSVAATKQRSVTKGLILQVRPWSEEEKEKFHNLHCRFGLTASKKTGNAVRRNRIRRRLRALAQEILPNQCEFGHDLVIIGRFCAWDRPWEDLKKDLQKALSHLKIYDKV